MMCIMAMVHNEFFKKTQIFCSYLCIDSTEELSIQSDNTDLTLIVEKKEQKVANSIFL